MWSLEVVEITSSSTLNQEIEDCCAQGSSSTHVLSCWSDELQLVRLAICPQWEAQWIGFIDLCHFPMLL